MATNVLTKVQKEISSELPYARSLIEELQAFEILNDDDQQTAADGLQEIKTRYNALEEKRKKITTPLNTAVKEVNNLFREPREALEECEKILKAKIAGYLAKVEADNAKALLAASQAETAEEAVEALAEVVATEPAKGVSVRYVWRAEVFRPEMVPFEFLSPDIEKIKANMEQSIAAGGEPMPIPGVRFHKEPIVSSRKVA